MRTYSELISIPSFLERYNYLRVAGKVGESTFGFQRWINQVLYHSDEWKRFKKDIVIRDNGNDLAVEGFGIVGPVLVHHLEPITYDDIVNRSPKILDPENVVLTKLSTHNAIHYGDESQLIIAPIVRTKNDTCPWRH